MTSPISSPQNLFAIERMSMEGGAPSWLSWFAVALPIALLGNGLCWLLLRLVYRDPTFVEVRPMQAIEVSLCSCLSCLRAGTAGQVHAGVTFTPVIHPEPALHADACIC